jgi:hypothetical protein
MHKYFLFGKQGQDSASCENMKQAQKTIVCTCGEIVAGKTHMEVMRKEMDHIRMYHQDRYDELMNKVSVRHLFGWLMAQIIQKPRIA